MIAFGMILSLIFFLGGGAIAYAILDAPRRKAKQELTRLNLRQAELDDYHARLESVAARLGERESALSAQAIDLDQRAKGLSFQVAEFGQRVISYDELGVENQILKRDLKNLAHQAAHHDFTQSDSHGALAALKLQRDRLGRKYFEEVIAATKKNVTPGNYISLKKRIEIAAAFVRVEGVDLTAFEVDRALSDLHRQYERAVRALMEREEQARLREEIRENQRAERERQEAEEEFERAEQEKRTIEEALKRALAEAAAERERRLGEVAEVHAEEVERLRIQLAEAEAKSQRALSMAQQTKVGAVYVISNMGSFGKDIFKIGMTRRLDPQDRVDELGDASVPFPFDVHMMIKCDDAPKLEAALHRAFHTKRVNKVNPRKEFFRATIDEIALAVRENHGEVEYRADAEALEYLQGLTMTEKEIQEVEDAFTEAAEDVGIDPEDLDDDDDEAT